MSRTLLWVALFAVYAATFAGRAGLGSKALDPMSPRIRAVERAIGEQRFADALPLADALRRSFPDHPLPAYLVARIYHGLDRPSDEAAAWETFMTLTSRPHEACPGVATAHERAGHREQSLPAFARCAELDPRDPERWLDLGDALARADQKVAADQAYRRGLMHDPLHATLLARIGAGAQEGEQ